MICNAQKRELNNAFHLLFDKDYKEAYECVKRAEVHEKTKTYYKTYKYKFMCIIEMYRQNDTIMLNSFVNPVDTADHALMKSMCYNFHDPEIKNLDYKSKEGLQVLHDNIEIALKASIPEVENLDNIRNDFFYRVPMLAKLYFAYAQEYRFQGLMDSAYSACKRSILLSEFNELYDTTAYALAGDIAFTQNNYTDAIKYFNKIINKDYGSDDSEKSKYFAKLAKSYLESGDTMKYISTARANTFKFKQQAHHETKKLLTFCIKNNYTSLMLESLDLLESIDKTYDGVFELKGELHQSQKQFDKALQYYRKYQALNKDNFDANYMLADCYMDYANHNGEIRDSLNTQALIYLENAKSINPYVSYVIKDIEKLQSEMNAKPNDN
jgi:tetratricopeptide (TPR) repeat protein